MGRVKHEHRDPFGIVATHGLFEIENDAVSGTAYADHNGGTTGNLRGTSRRK